ncbi:MAG: hypothetical protein U0893_04250 [Chloroflexota bacterium]
MSLTSALTAVSDRLIVRRSVVAPIAIGALMVSSLLLADTASAASPMGVSVSQGQASRCPSPAGLRLPAGWAVDFDNPQTPDREFPYAAIITPDSDDGSGLLYRLPAAPDAATALKQRLQYFHAGIEGPTQVRSITVAPTRNAESNAAALVQATDDNGPFFAYFVVATSGTLTCSLEVEVPNESALANAAALAALMESFFLVP